MTNPTIRRLLVPCFFAAATTGALAADKHADIVRRLQAVAQTTKDDLGVDGVGPGCRPSGRVADPQPLLAYDGTVRADAVGSVKRFP